MAAAPTLFPSPSASAALSNQPSLREMSRRIMVRELLSGECQMIALVVGLVTWLLAAAVGLALALGLAAYGAAAWVIAAALASWACSWWRHKDGAS